MVKDQEFAVASACIEPSWLYDRSGTWKATQCLAPIGCDQVRIHSPLTQTAACAAFEIGANRKREADGLDSHNRRDYLRVEGGNIGECHAVGLRLHCDSRPCCKLRLVSRKPGRSRIAAGTDRTSAAKRQRSAPRCCAGRTAGRWLSRGATA